MRLAALAGLAGLSLLLGACSAVDGTGHAATPVPAMTAATQAASAPQAPVAWTIQQAQLQYLRDVALGNDDAQTIDSLLCSCALQQPVTAITSACTRQASDDQTFTEELSSGQWPTSVQEPIQGLIAAIGVERDGLLHCAKQTTTLAAFLALHDVVFSGPAADPVRAALGLPPRLGASSADVPTAESTPV